MFESFCVPFQNVSHSKKISNKSTKRHAESKRCGERDGRSYREVETKNLSFFSFRNKEESNNVAKMF